MMCVSRLPSVCRVNLSLVPAYFAFFIFVLGWLFDAIVPGRFVRLASSARCCCVGEAEYFAVRCCSRSKRCCCYCCLGFVTSVFCPAHLEQPTPRPSADALPLLLLWLFCLWRSRPILAGSLSPVVSSTIFSRPIVRSLNLELSLFERLESAGHPVHMLTVQYRMHPEIRAFPSGERLSLRPERAEPHRSTYPLWWGQASSCVARD